MQVCAEVVVGGGAPEVGCQLSAFGKHVGAVDAVLAHEPVCAAEFDVNTGGGHYQVVCLVVDNGWLHGGTVCLCHVGYCHVGGGRLCKSNLFARHSGARLKNSVTVFERVCEVEQVFSIRFERAVVDCHLAGGLGSRVNIFNGACAYCFAVAQQLPCESVVAEVGEKVFVVHVKHSLGKVCRGGVDALHHTSHLVHVRIGHTVGAYEPIVAEIYVGSVKTVEVAAVAVNLHTVLAFPAGRLVNEVPDKSALKVGIFSEKVPVLLEASFGVAHCVGVLALNHRFGHIGTFAVFLHLLVADVHGAVDVGVVGIAAAFVLNRAAGVFGFHPFICVHKVGTVAALVAERPEYYARVVEVALHIALVAFKVCLSEQRHFGECAFAVAHAVGFEVGFRNHIYAVFVAEVVPQVVVRIVACAHCVDVELLHQFDVLHHAFGRNNIAAVGVKLVAVGAFEQHRFAVYQNLRAFQLYFAESHIYRNCLVAAFERGVQGV